MKENYLLSLIGMILSNSLNELISKSGTTDELFF